MFESLTDREKAIILLAMHAAEDTLRSFQPMHPYQEKTANDIQSVHNKLTDGIGVSVLLELMTMLGEVKEALKEAK